MLHVEHQLFLVLVQHEASVAALGFAQLLADERVVGGKVAQERGAQEGRVLLCRIS